MQLEDGILSAHGLPSSCFLSLIFVCRFKILGLVVYMLSDALHVHTLPIINSCLLVLDTLVVLAIYFAPKLLEALKPELESRSASLFSRQSGRSSNKSSNIVSKASVSNVLDPVREVNEADYEGNAGAYPTNSNTEGINKNNSHSKMLLFDGNISDSNA